jgi:6-pyruvoyltetrahydropterin/6-carboxytetrahydropterin synthase
MKPVYTLKVITDFAAAHVAGYPNRAAGCTVWWKLEVEVAANALDEQGMGLDFKVIRKPPAHSRRRSIIGISRDRAF